MKERFDQPEQEETFTKTCNYCEYDFITESIGATHCGRDCFFADKADCKTDWEGG